MLRITQAGEPVAMPPGVLEVAVAHQVIDDEAGPGLPFHVVLTFVHTGRYPRTHTHRPTTTRTACSGVRKLSATASATGMFSPLLASIQ